VGFLRDVLKPRIIDWAMGSTDELRPEALAAASGSVLEVGFGTGRNLRHYPGAVDSLVGLDPMPPRWKRVAERISLAPFPVEHHQLRADGRLPFEDARFDCVVTTWTLCSIPDPLAALAEMRRILRPGGRYLFVEHGRSDDPSVARWQDRLNPIHRRIADGCHMNRRIDALVRDGGFALEKLDRFRYQGPRVLAEMYRGVALRSD
jgi:ubiquinone/menaquinone biosynthesis C-methylase UbiE